MDDKHTSLSKLAHETRKDELTASPVERGVMCKCGCQGKANCIVKSEDYEGRPFEEPCCQNSALYLRECAFTFDKPYEEKTCT